MLAEIMRTGAASMGLPMTAEQAAQFAAYHGMLASANARMNLTRVPDDPRESADRNYLDSIAILSQNLPHAERAVDVGSGAGFPGVPLAIMLPETRFTLLDSQARRVDFLASVIDALGLNAEAVHARAEDAARRPELRERCDMAVARAVAPLRTLCELMLPFVRVGGTMVSMKGPTLDQELAEALLAIRLLGGGAPSVVPLPIPGRDWDHRAALIPKTEPTPERYPRGANAIQKKPL